MIINCNSCKFSHELLSCHQCSTCDDEFINWESCDNDLVHQPAHYTEYPKEVVDIIKFVLGDEGFKAWCIGNELKYRLRAGLKDPDKLLEDMQKAMKIRDWRQ